MNIPRDYTGPVYFHWNSTHGFLCCGLTDLGRHEEYVLLGQTEVSVEFGDIRQQAADAIDQEIKKTKADLLHRIETLQRRKQELLALEVA